MVAEAKQMHPDPPHELEQEFDGTAREVDTVRDFLAGLEDGANYRGMPGVGSALMDMLARSLGKCSDLELAGLIKRGRVAKGRGN